MNSAAMLQRCVQPAKGCHGGGEAGGGAPGGGRAYVRPVCYGFCLAGISVDSSDPGLLLESQR